VLLHKRGPHCWCLLLLLDRSWLLWQAALSSFLHLIILRLLLLLLLQGQPRLHLCLLWD
jgi:hypothetical protein